MATCEPKCHAYGIGCACRDDDPDNVHVIERPEDYLSDDLLRFLADEKAKEATPHCATCRCGEAGNA